MAAKRKHANLIRNLPALIPEPQPEPEPRDRFGRPSSFRPEYVEQARILCEEGATDKELAQFFEVSKMAIYRWRLGHPEFAAVCKLGKSIADDRMERTAYELATGYSVTVTETFKLRNAQGDEVLAEREVERYIPPNDNMLRWMLKNRRPDTWRDKTETEAKHVVVHLTADQAKDRLKAKIEAMRQSRLGDSEQAEG